MFDCITKYDWIVIFSNVLFFMVVQTFFFLFIASKQYETVLAGKMDFVSRFANKSQYMKNKLKSMKDDYIAQNGKVAERQLKERTQENKKYIMKYCVLPITLVVGALLFVIFFKKYSTPWSSIDSLNLALVLLAYATELYFFFFIVRKFEFVGDQYILANIYKEATK